MKQFGKIFKFELYGYLKNKIFVGITAFLVVAIAIVMFIPNIIALVKGDGEPDTDNEQAVMLIYSEDKSLTELLSLYFSEAFTEFSVKTETESVEDLKRKIIDGSAECAFAISPDLSYTYYVNNLSMYDVNTEIANEILSTVYRMSAMIENGISPELAGAIISKEISGSVEALGKNQADNFIYTYIMIFALYTVILLYGQMVSTNVATEKSSRAMELLVTSATPSNMMFGKVLASCTAGFLQLVLIFGSAITFYNINKSNLTNPLIASIFDIPLSLFLYMIVFFILGFLIYAFMFGAIGSTASKLEDINTSTMPLMFLFIIAFMVVMFSMTGGSVDNTLMIICSYVPFTSPMAMFTRIAMSTVEWYEILISISILVCSTGAIGILAAKIYKVGVLLYGTPPKLSVIIKTIMKTSVKSK